MPTSTGASGEGPRDERVMVFIDGSNLYHVLTQDCERHDLVFEKFVKKLATGRNLLRTYYYNIRQEPTFNPQASQEQEKFLSALLDTPYLEVRLGVHKRHGDIMVEKGVDVMIATDLVVGAYRDLYDTAILVSGDGDFYPAIQAAKDVGKHIEVAAFENNLSPEAKRAADVTILLTKSYFTGLWTTRRKRTTKSTATKSTAEGAGAPAAASRRTAAKQGATKRAPAASSRTRKEAVAADEEPTPAPAAASGGRNASRRGGNSAGRRTKSATPSTDDAAAEKRRSTTRKRPGTRQGSATRGAKEKPDEPEQSRASESNVAGNGDGDSETANKQSSPARSRRRRLVGVSRGSAAPEGGASGQETGAPGTAGPGLPLVGWLRRRRSAHPAAAQDGESPEPSAE